LKKKKPASERFYEIDIVNPSGMDERMSELAEQHGVGPAGHSLTFLTSCCNEKLVEARYHYDFKAVLLYCAICRRPQQCVLVGQPEPDQTIICLAKEDDDV
jgi:hypothetical protein